MSLSQSDVKALEQLRQRLSQLTNSISTLQRDLMTSDPLPPWPQLSSLLSIISQNLSDVSSTQAQHAALLSALAVYPLPAFPGRAEEGLLHQLLRKKLEPEVEDWVEEGRAAGLDAGGADAGATATGLDANGLKGLWDWAGGAANELARSHHWGGDYTKEEVEAGVEHVQTGLRRKLRVPGDEEDSSEEDEDEDMEDVGEVQVRRSSLGQGVELDILKDATREEKPLSLGEQFKFTMSGQAPRVA